MVYHTPEKLTPPLVFEGMSSVFEKLISSFVGVGTGNIGLNFKLDILEIKLRARGGVLKKYVEVFLFFFSEFFFFNVSVGEIFLKGMCSKAYRSKDQ